MSKQLLRSIRVRNFKAIRETGALKLSPLTVFIGNNGSGKSSFLEALETFQAVAQNGVDEAMRPWHGFEHIWSRAVAHEDKEETRDKRAHQTNPMSFSMSGWMPLKTIGGAFSAETALTMGQGGNQIFIQHEEVKFRKGLHMTRNDRGIIDYPNGPDRIRRKTKLDDGESILQDLGIGGLGRWQFLGLVPQNMGEPSPQKRAGGEVRLAKDGRNIAQYLRWIRDQDSDAYYGIAESLRSVLSYARDIQPALTSELERTVYLQMTEKDFKVPGWLFSTGTLRILALLALLRSPSPPPLIAVEEIENGLDPRTTHLILDEIRTAIHDGRSQVLMTSHSPYLLDLLPLQTLVLCERDEEGAPRFWRPSDSTETKSWAKSFAPGHLYTTGRLSRRTRS
ncbi:MAG: AAA family ATPase [Candidatus Hydrogenedentes bacterium]|nr:AAA family ATPase [Candidatus Hydrogenedentota bacterium]